MKPCLIEGFFGQAWTNRQRIQAFGFLKQSGFNAYIYAPKSDVWLRERWKESHPAEEWRALRACSAAAREAGIGFGIGLSPYELHLNLDQGSKRILVDKCRRLLELEPTILALLFDDMRGDLPDLAERQIEIVHAVESIVDDDVQLMTCPSYYSDDPILDRVFGSRPNQYLERLGAGLSQSVQVFWTGPRVISKSYPSDHLESIAKKLQRKPYIWDNYPVNDGPKMCKRLHLSPFNSFGEGFQDRVSGIAVNPMNQAWLSRLPISSLATALEGGCDSMEQAVSRLEMGALGELLVRDAALFLVGLEAIDSRKRAKLIAEYGQWQHPAAIEVVSWLNNETIVGPECLTNV